MCPALSIRPTPPPITVQRPLTDRLALPILPAGRGLFVAPRSQIPPPEQPRARRRPNLSLLRLDRAISAHRVPRNKVRYPFSPGRRMSACADGPGRRLRSLSEARPSLGEAG